MSEAAQPGAPSSRGGPLTDTSRTVLGLTLVLVLRERDGVQEILLGEKRRGFGAGRVVAPGGKIDAGESPRHAAARELAEETGLHIDAATLAERGVVTFVFPHGTGPDLRTPVFALDADAQLVEGALAASDELAAAWVPVPLIPYRRMWDDARHWLPHALDGTLREATFWYAADGVTVDRFTLHPSPAGT